MSPVDLYRAEKAAHAARMAILFDELRPLLGDDRKRPSAQGERNKRRVGREGMPDQTEDELRAKRAEYYQRNREARLAYQKAHHAQRLVSQRSRRRKKAQWEKNDQWREWYANNREAHNAKRRARRAANSAA